jgi:hypothetical protein
VQIVALLSWYDERPSWLAGLTASLAGMADHIIAVDGAYGLYPQGKGGSPAEQAEAIRETARGVGMGCTIHEPRHAWPGNEVEKRDFMFRAGEQITDPDDWYFIIDGDELVTDAGLDLHAECGHSSHDAAEVTMWQYREHAEPHERPFSTALVEESAIRIIFRAIRGLAVRGKHYIYVTPDGRHLWGDGCESMAPASNFQAVRVQHRNKSRDLWRAKAGKGYYEIRDRLNVEGLMHATN